MDKNVSLLPWYINHTLPEKERNAVEDWLQYDIDAQARYQETQRLAKIVRNQETQTPSSLVKTGLLAQVRGRAAHSKTSQLAWAWGAPLLLLIFVLLWLLVQPGTQLQWSVNGNQPAAFRIYRVQAGSTRFKLLEEVIVNPEQHSYQFTDGGAVIPGQTYLYLVEAVGQNGNTFISSTTASNTLETFAAQFAILLTSFVLTFGMITIIQELKSPLETRSIT